jgi:hypothetical protein
MMNFLPKICGIPQHSNFSIVWEGEEQGLNISLPQCGTPIVFFLLFWSTNMKVMCYDQFVCYQRVEGGGIKGRVNWV